MARIDIEGIFEAGLLTTQLLNTMRFPVALPGTPTGEWRAIQWVDFQTILEALDRSLKNTVQVSSNGVTWSGDSPWPADIRWWRFRLGTGAFTPPLPITDGMTPHQPWVTGSTAPANPTRGQGWFNPSDGKLRIFDGSIWVVIGPTAAPTPAPTPADTTLIGTVASEIVGVQPGPGPTTYTRHIAISTDTTFDEAEFLAGSESATNHLVVPTWSGGRRYIAIAVPDTTGDINSISVGGIGISMAFTRVPGTLDINGLAYKLWRTINDQADNASGQIYTVGQV